MTEHSEADDGGLTSFDRIAIILAKASGLGHAIADSDTEIETEVYC